MLEYRAGAVTRSVRKQGCARVWRSDAQITGVYRIPLLELRKNSRTGTPLSDSLAGVAASTHDRLSSPKLRTAISEIQRTKPTLVSLRGKH